MASNVPTVRQFSRIWYIPRLSVIGLIFYLFYQLNVENPILYGALAYVALSLGLQTQVPKSHRKGMKLVKQLKFNEAIPYFEKSLLFFKKYSWIDKYRYLVLLSASSLSYKEMALCNIAFCYSQTMNGKKAKEYYEFVLAEFPENGLAKAGLNMLKSID